MQIVEIFHSIQGEGRNIGLPTTFVRTGGCNLRCEWCDTSYAWEGGEEMDADEISRLVQGKPPNRVCVTGGEPLLQDDILDLIETIPKQYEVSVETNGSKDISDLVEEDMMVSMDYKTPSSGMSEKMKDENLSLLRKRDQVKFVIADDEDFDFAVHTITKLDDIKPQIIFQPVGGTDIKLIADRVVREGMDVRVLPQLHKFIWGDEKGV